MKEMLDLICGKAAVGGNYNLTRDNKSKKTFIVVVSEDGYVDYVSS